MRLGRSSPSSSPGNPGGSAATSASPSGNGADRRTPGLRLAAPPRRRSTPYLVLGVVLVLGCALAFGVFSLRVGGRQPVLQLARPVPAGHVLTDGDLRVARVAAEPGVDVVPASSRSSVVGQSVRMPLAAGSLLASAQLGPGAFPPAGKAVAGVAVKPGQYPPSLAAGAQVAVLVAQARGTPQAAGGRGSPTGPARLVGTVLAVDTNPADPSGGAVVELLMSEDAALWAGAAQAGQVSLVQLAADGGG